MIATAPATISTGAAGGNITITADTNNSGLGNNDDGTILFAAGADITAGTGNVTFSLTDCDGEILSRVISSTNIVKNGAGALRLSGGTVALPNNFTGQTLVNAGFLLINGVLTDGSPGTAGGDVVVASGAVLGGDGDAVASGIINGGADVVVLSGGILDPGDVSKTDCSFLTGRLTIEDSVVFQDGSMFRVQLNGLVARTGYDQLVVNGTIDIGNGSNAAQQTILNTNVGFSVPIGGRFEIVVNDLSDNVLPDPGVKFVKTDGVTPIPEGGFFTSGGTATLFNITYQADAIGGINNGGTNDIVLTAPGRFDYNGIIFQDFLFGNPIESPTAVGWLNVPEHTLKTPSNNHGWDRLIPSFDRVNPTDLLRDGHYADNVPATFQVDVVPNETYRVVLQVGDYSFLHDLDQITIYDGANLPSTGQVKMFTTAAGDFATIVFDNVVIGASGKLYVQFVDGGGLGEGADPHFVINAMDVRPTSSVGILTLTRNDADPLTTPKDADGLTVDTYTGAGAPPNSLITIATTNGTVTSADQDPNTRGVQVLADGGGVFSFTVRRPASSTDGTILNGATISAGEVTGLSFGSAIQAYKVAALRRFDFNRGTLSPNAAGFIGVAGANMYSASLGYGWQTAAGDTDRGSGSRTFTDLRRDLHYGVAANTFRFEVVPGQACELRVYVGDYSLLRDQIQVSIEGAAPYLISSVAPGVFDLRVTVGVSADSVMDITFSDLGGTALGWVVNGIEVATPGALPGAPEIDVQTGVTAVLDGGTVAFGSTSPLTPVQKTFVVANSGLMPLTLGTITFPVGFSVASGFGATTLQPGETTSFTLQLDALSAGSFSGTVSFATNDADENPFDFTVSGSVVAPVSLIIDNGDAGFSAPGYSSITGQGFQNGVHYTAAGNGSAVATWTFNGLTPGMYRVSANWSTHSNRATIPRTRSSMARRRGGRCVSIRNSSPSTGRMRERTGRIWLLVCDHRIDAGRQTDQCGERIRDCGRDPD